MKIKYAPKDLGCTPDEAFDFECSEPVILLGEDLAEDYHWQHDGWEDSWPVTFEVWNVDYEKIKEITVDREAVPSFTTTDSKELH